MARFIEDDSGGVRVVLRGVDVSDWADRPGHAWPASQLRGKAGWAEFDAWGDLVDICDTWREVDSNELNACVSDFLAARYGKDHAAIRGEPNPVDWVKRTYPKISPGSVFSLRCVEASAVLSDEEIETIEASDVSWGDARQSTLIDPATVLEDFDRNRMPNGVTLVWLER